MRPLGGYKVDNALRRRQLKEPKTVANIPQFINQAQFSDSSLNFNYFTGVFNIGLFPRRFPCDALNDTLDRYFNPLTTSVDGLDLLVDIGKLTETSNDVYDKSRSMTSSSYTYSLLNSLGANEQQIETMDVSYLLSDIFCQVMLVIKKPTNENTISKAMSSLSSLIVGWSVKKCHWEWTNGNKVYKKLVRPEHHIQFRQHCCVVDLCFGIYVK